MHSNLWNLNHHACSFEKIFIRRPIYFFFRPGGGRFSRQVVELESKNYDVRWRATAWLGDWKWGLALGQKKGMRASAFHLVASPQRKGAEFSQMITLIVCVPRQQGKTWDVTDSKANTVPPPVATHRSHSSSSSGNNYGCLLFFFLLSFSYTSLHGGINITQRLSTNTVTLSPAATSSIFICIYRLL